MASELKRQIVLSPISLLELVAQIACSPEEALASIHDLGSWADTDNLQLLGWRDAFLAYWIFGKAVDDGISEQLQRVLKTCYASERADAKLQEDAGALLDFLKGAKRQKAALLQRAVAEIRRSGPPKTREELKLEAHRGLVGGLRSQLGIPDEASDNAIAGCLVAYFEYHAAMVERALGHEEFNFLRHANDHFDAEQLVFLADPSLHFFTTDTGYRDTARVEPRIHILDAHKLKNGAAATDVLTAEIGKGF